MSPTVPYRSTTLHSSLSSRTSQYPLERCLRSTIGKHVTACWPLRTSRVAHRHQIVFYSMNGKDLGDRNGSSQPSGIPSSNGSDAQGTSDRAMKSIVEGGGGGSDGGSDGSGNGGIGGGGGGNGNSDGRGDNDHSTSYTFFPGVLSQVLQPRTLLVVVLLVIYKWASSRHMLLKEREIATAAATAAGHDGSGVSESHELAKQLFDDFLFEADASSASGAAAGYSSTMQLRQHSPGPVKRLRLWFASPFTRGGDVAELKASVSELRQDICALKRLQRDAFEQLLRTSERLEDAEQDGGASDRGTVAGTTLLGGSARRNKGNAGTSGRPHVQVSGQLVYAREMVSLETGEGDTEFDEGHCQPPMMHINLSTASQDSGSSLQAQLRINSQPKDGDAMDPVLHKVLYQWAVSERLKVLCAVVNGRGDDVAATMNPQAGRGITPLMRHGCTIHQKAAGEGLGFRLKGEDFTISGGHLRHTEDSDGDQSSTSMLQLDCSPSQQLALGLVAARHSNPPAPPSRRGDATRSDSSRSQLQDSGSSSSSAQGGHPQISNNIGITGAWRSRYDEVAVSGWMALSGARNIKEQDWGLALSSIPMPNGEGWGLAFGRGSWNCGTHSIPAPARPLMLEASLQFNAGGGLLLSPSLICTRAHDSLRAAVAVRSEVNF